ncbi:MAG: AraC family transcriptional regulator [Bacteroidota bacterium]
MKAEKSNYYLQEVDRIINECYSNQIQIDMAVAAKRYIDQNFEQDINLDLLAHIGFASKCHLLRIFKRYHGITPRQYLIHKRISEAKKQLQKGASVSNACYAVGFNSLNSFSILFKKKTGKSPSSYRKAIFDK